jgi:hypothetical protein
MTTLDAFKEFIERVGRVRVPAVALPTVHEEPADRFRAFSKGALGILENTLEASRDELSITARPAARWIGKHDLLALGALSLVENAYTRLLAWALEPKTHEPTALGRQRAWLAHAGIQRTIRTACAPLRFLRTSDGIPDLVLAYPEFAVVVEAKTVTYEHLTPGGSFQSHAYGPAVAAVLGLPPDAVETVFLTLDRALPENTGARPVSHLGSFLTIASALDDISLPGDVEAGFRTILTHFAATADRPMRDLRRTLVKLGASPSAFPAIAELTSAELKDLLIIHRLLGGNAL